MQNEEELGSLRSDHPLAEDQEIDNSNFTLQKRTLNSLEVLNDTDVDMEDWLSSSQDSSWVIKTLKLWFTLHKSHNKEGWTQFPQVLADESFFDNAKNALQSISVSFAKYIEDSVKEFDFSEETLFRL